MNSSRAERAARAFSRGVRLSPRGGRSAASVIAGTPKGISSIGRVRGEPGPELGTLLLNEPSVCDGMDTDGLGVGPPLSMEVLESGSGVGLEFNVVERAVKVGEADTDAVGDDVGDSVTNTDGKAVREADGDDVGVIEDVVDGDEVGLCEGVTVALFSDDGEVDSDGDGVGVIGKMLHDPLTN